MKVNFEYYELSVLTIICIQLGGNFINFSVFKHALSCCVYALPVGREENCWRK